VKDLSIIVIIPFVLGFIIQIFGSDISIIFYCFGIFLGFELYAKNERYKELKITYTRSLKELLNFDDNSSYMVFEFSKDRLLLSSDFLCSWFYWSDFIEFKIIKSNLLLFEKDNSQNILVISKCELKEGEFEEILKFIGEKIN
tara:strand:- start:79 stop:507 length:429 start_codon:yes stop_codon:yes gene_type:complete